MSFSELNWNILGPNKDGWTPVAAPIPAEVKQHLTAHQDASPNQPHNKRRKNKSDA